MIGLRIPAGFFRANDSGGQAVTVANTEAHLRTLLSAMGSQDAAREMLTWLQGVDDRGDYPLADRVMQAYLLLSNGVDVPTTQEMISLVAVEAEHPGSRVDFIYHYLAERWRNNQGDER